MTIPLKQNLNKLYIYQCNVHLYVYLTSNNLKSKHRIYFVKHHGAMAAWQLLTHPSVPRSQLLQWMAYKRTKHVETHDAPQLEKKYMVGMFLLISFDHETLRHWCDNCFRSLCPWPHHHLAPEILPRTQQILHSQNQIISANMCKSQEIRWWLTKAWFHLVILER